MKCIDYRVQYTYPYEVIISSLPPHHIPLQSNIKPVIPLAYYILCPSFLLFLPYISPFSIPSFFTSSSLLTIKMDTLKTTISENKNIFLLSLIIITILGISLIILDKYKTGNTKNRRASTAKTPPRSVSPQQEKEKKKEKDTTPYINTLPPQRSQGPHEDVVKKNLIPMTQDYRSSNSDGLYTPTGYSIEEVKKLGDFPDYSVLTGVSHPRAYLDFDIEKALPRPYRPFRWPYHQTMCMSVVFVVNVLW